MSPTALIHVMAPEVGALAPTLTALEKNGALAPEGNS
jgi:hypothetical protein